MHSLATSDVLTLERVDDIVDPKTVAQVRREIKSLDTEIQQLENAPTTNDAMLAEKKANLARLRAYLANASRSPAAAAAGGTSRKFSNRDEKARKAVSKSIKEAIEQIRNDGLPELADHLTNAFGRAECGEGTS